MGRLRDVQSKCGGVNWASEQGSHPTHMPIHSSVRSHAVERCPLLYAIIRLARGFHRGLTEVCVAEAHVCQLAHSSSNVTEQVHK